MFSFYIVGLDGVVEVGVLVDIGVLYCMGLIWIIFLVFWINLLGWILDVFFFGVLFVGFECFLVVELIVFYKIW